MATTVDLPILREKLQKHGAATLSEDELLALLFRTGADGSTAAETARNFLNHVEDFTFVADLSEDEMRAAGLGNAQIAQVMAAIELGKRLFLKQPLQSAIRSISDVIPHIDDMRGLTQENVRVILLDNSNRVLRTKTIYIGTVNSSVVRVGEVLREPVRANAPAFILVHNHPSGDANPSPEDVDFTRAVIQGGEVLDIQLLDHVIISKSGWKSLRDLGLGFS